MSGRATTYAFALALISLCMGVIGGFPAKTSAQSTLNLIFSTDLALDISPAHPAPGDDVHAVARSSFLDLSEVMLAWKANGKPLAEGVGIREIDIPAGALGSDTRLTVVATEDGLEFASAEAHIRPVMLDLLWESDSYVPPFYRGRALPSAGTNLRLEAIPRFVRAGSTVPPSTIMFTWRRNGYVIGSASGRGKSKATIESPGLYGVDTISVEAKTTDGALVGVASARIAARSPRVLLYRAHPVFGISYHFALSQENENRIEEAEASFSAIPYFAEVVYPDDPALDYEWSVNGVGIENDKSTPSTITINAEGSSGEAQLDLALSHVTNLFLNASNAWSFIFNSRFGETPFGSAK